jgi:hypothetical protein
LAQQTKKCGSHIGAAFTRTPAVDAQGDFRLSQRELGTRESVNKCLQEWQHDGAIHMRRGVISISDRGALGALAEQD